MKFGFWYCNGMKITIDLAGRLVIPKSLRDQAGIQPGMDLEIEYRNGLLELSPVCTDIRIVKRGNRKVLSAPGGTPKLTAKDVRKIVEEIRAERDTIHASSNR